LLNINLFTLKYKNSAELSEAELALAQYRSMYINTVNFVGAQHLLSIKKKQQLNSKITSTTTLLSRINNTNASVTPTLLYGGAPRQTKKSEKNTLSVNGKEKSVEDGSTTSSPSSSSTISPSLSPRSSSSPNEQNDYTPVLTAASSSVAPTSATLSINSARTLTTNISSATMLNEDTFMLDYDDLNERLFACFLSNLSCKLVEQFLNSFNNQHNASSKSANGLESDVTFKSGFIRKKHTDSSFTYVNMRMNEQEDDACENSNNDDEASLNLARSRRVKDTDRVRHMLKLNVNKSTIKLCVRLPKWPETFMSEYFKRKRVNTKWPTNKLLEQLERDGDSCLISLCTYGVDASQWSLDTRLAELVLFSSFNKVQLFLFNFFYLTLVNLEVTLSKSASSPSSRAKRAKTSTTSGNKLFLFDFISERIFLHHYMRFIELNEFNFVSTDNRLLTLVNLFELLNKFSKYLRYALEKHATLNKPNYFNLSKFIMSRLEYETMLLGNEKLIEMLRGSTVDLSTMFAADLLDSLSNFELTLNSNLLGKLKSNAMSKLTSSSSLSSLSSSSLKLCEHFFEIIKIRLANKRMNLSNGALVAKHSSVNSTSEASVINTSKFYSPLVAHNSACTFIYEYVYEFTNELFEQFKCKRDNFQINENLLLQIHDKIINEQLSQLNNNSSKASKQILTDYVKNINRDLLLNKFEEYAECVHKYLPQIRHHNQYLLFHYVWTMQVQYLAPFFNYLCDYYPSFDN
jgi:hypothetical protein